MKFVKVNELPEREPRREHKQVAPELQEFLDMGAKYAKVNLDPWDYSSIYSAAATFNRVSQYHKLPIKSTYINGEVYLIRTDMED